MFYIENNWTLLAAKTKKCGTISSTVALIFCLIVLFSLFCMNMDSKVYVIYIDGTKAPKVLNKNFLSVAIDSSTIATNFKSFNITDPKLVKVMSPLAPAFLRIGGTMADQLIFSPNAPPSPITDSCTYPEKECTLANFTMNAQQWLSLNELAEKSGFQILFDLNALTRHPNGSWDSSNAEKLVSFSHTHGLRLNWQLGNEPDLFLHHYNYSVNASQLAHDFNSLRRILDKYPRYSDSLLVGPDVTRPRLDSNKSQDFLKDFLEASPEVDAITWHQYYLDGRTAKAADFVNPDLFDILKWQLIAIQELLGEEHANKSVWIAETASAYGGGAPGLSNKFIASFLWLDKLGLAAEFGIDVVVRQTLFGTNSYSLVDARFNPAPDWWLSVLYKRLVSGQVLDSYMARFARVRLYCHCANVAGKMVIFGMNLGKVSAKVRIEERQFLKLLKSGLKVEAYVLNTPMELNSSLVFLNGVLLKLDSDNNVPMFEPKIVPAYPYLTMPPFSIVFWLVKTDDSSLC